MDLKTHLGIAALLAVLLTVGAFQGDRLDRLQEAESFYRWLVTASTHMRREGTLEFADTSLKEEPLDDELFGTVVGLGETFLPDLEVDLEEDVDETGAPYSRLLRAVRQGEDRLVWELASSSEVTEARAEFLELSSAGRLQSLGTQFKTASLYQDDTQVFGVGMASMFFGFRKVAANFLWLQVDKYWHLGQMHRMIPLMRTTVTLDPNFVDAYLLGGWHMAYNITAQLPDTPEAEKVWSERHQKRLGLKEEWYYAAADFLKDGIAKNPRDFRLYFDLGYGVYDQKLQDYENAVRYLDAALEHPHERWVPRMYYNALKSNGQYEEAIEGWQEYLEIFPAHPVALTGIQINEALIAEEKWVDARECLAAAETAAEAAEQLARDARDLGDTATAVAQEEILAQARATADSMRSIEQENNNRAIAIWVSINEEGESAQAEAKLLYFQAMAYADEGRAYEAIGLLDEARWEYAVGFQELSNAIIDIKRDNGLALSVSEELDIERQKEAAQFRQEEVKPRTRRIDCDFLYDDTVQASAASDETRG